MKTAIYGAGAMGTTLGTFLTLGGEDVTLITRNQEHIDGLQSLGGVVRCIADNKEFRAKVKAVLPSEISEKYDIVFLMTKQRDNEKHAQAIAEILTENGVVVTTQNGLPEERLANILGKEKVLGGVCTFGANMLGGGVVEMTSKIQAMRIEIGSFGSNQVAEERVLTVLKKAGEFLSNPEFATVSENLQGVRWNKLTVNAAFSSLSAVTGLTFGQIAKQRKTAKIALKIMQECFAVQEGARVKRELMQGKDLKKIFAKGGFFKTQLELFLLPIAMKRHKKLKSGMLADIQKGRKCEIEYIAGAVSETGKKYGVDTPYSDTCVELVRGIENGLYELTEKNVAFFQGL